ncbi:Jasmonate-induced oxygenase 2 [Asimina triloba]
MAILVLEITGACVTRPILCRSIVQCITHKTWGKTTSTSRRTFPLTQQSPRPSHKTADLPYQRLASSTTWKTFVGLANRTQRNATQRMEPLQEWPEPVVPVQSLSESCAAAIPDRYVKPPSQRPSTALSAGDGVNIPLVDLGAIRSDEGEIMRKISEACREWGFFQVVNHGVSPELLRRTREVWRTFFHLPLEQKKVYANSPKTYEGYGSRLGTEKGAILDWGDYFFLHFLPHHLRDKNKWPSLPTHARDAIEEYGTQVVKLCGTLMKILSKNLGLEEDHLQNAFGGEDVGACLRVNFYPTCPQPDLTLGLSSHSDPGGLTLLLPDERVTGLQVRRGDAWVTVKPAQDSFIVNIGDQIQPVDFLSRSTSRLTLSSTVHFSIRIDSCGRDLQPPGGTFGVRCNRLNLNLRLRGLSIRKSDYLLAWEWDVPASHLPLEMLPFH